MRKIILFHDSGQGYKSLDILVHKNIAKLWENYEIIKGNVYYINCKYVKKFLEKNKDLVYIGSQDLGHIDLVNNLVRRMIKVLKENGFEEINF